MDKRSPRDFSWLINLLILISLATWVSKGKAGESAPVWLAFALPAALSLSPTIRERVSFYLWELAVVPTALYLWVNSGPDTSELTWPGLLLLGLLSGVASLAISLRFKELNPPLWLLSGLVVLVAYFSSGHGSADPMMHWWLRMGLSEGQAHDATIAFRKTVHFTFYGSVGWSAFAAILRAGGSRREAWRSGPLTVFAVATFDELRQSGFQNRSGSAWDVLLDVTGGLVFLGLLEMRSRKER